ncbi:hypothetical protein ACW0TQ_19400 [Oceanobacillus sp. M60]|uniref:hypothetical protein n=2 Tax=Oceanobacillus TaxID=182709 RepID=UPI002116C775|nr:hypothetical protein [Oceanobacillus oncorhynchi]UUI39493.1 hypothetical protein NP440_19555 [Oceanobacillus oncorhynchi]
MLSTISFVQSPFLKLRILNTKGVIKLCVIIMIHVKRNTIIIVSAAVTRRKSVIMIGVGEMITMVTKTMIDAGKIIVMITETMIDIKEITIVANDVRKNSVIAVTGIIKDKQL